MIFAFANQKGGVGKTTTVVNLAAYVAEMKKRVLAIDLDPQSNLTSSLLSVDSGVDPNKAELESIYHVLLGDRKIAEVFKSTDVENLFVVPSSIGLAGAEIEMVNQLSRESILENVLKPVASNFDFIFIDCPPSLGLLTINALVAADKLIIPVQCEYYALEGLSQLLETIRLVKKLNDQLEIGGVVLTMFDARTKLSSKVVDEVNGFFGERVFKTIIPRNVKLSEAPSHSKPISLHDPKSTGAAAYKKLARAFVKRFT